jgi:RNA polymerase sigma-70 factor (ECF subfamily)
MQSESQRFSVAMLRAGGPTLLAECFDEHREQLRQLVRRRLDPRLKQRVDASDILQEGFIEAASRLEGYLQQPSMSLLDWLKFIVRQRMLIIYRRHASTRKRDFRREMRRQDCGSQSEARPFDIAAATSTPSQIVSRREQHAQLWRALDEMPEADRRILRLRHLEQTTNAEAAARLGISEVAARKRYFRAVVRLRARLAADAVESHSQSSAEGPGR